MRRRVFKSCYNMCVNIIIFFKIFELKDYYYHYYYYYYYEW
ncbi:MAG: hypothetical protein N6V49_12360 [Serratia symbiotica]|nr:hypothetical protein [Serratia symbiotica]